MEINPNSFNEAIKKYLDGRAATDEEFAAKYANPDKSVDKCCTYIIQEVRKSATAGKTNAVAMTDEEVFGLAVHFYDETDIKVDEKAAAGVNVVASPTIARKAEASVTVSTPAPKKRSRKSKAAAAESDPNIPEPLVIPVF